VKTSTVAITTIVVVVVVVVVVTTTGQPSGWTLTAKLGRSWELSVKKMESSGQLIFLSLCRLLS